MLTLPNLLRNVIEAGNRNVPEASQLLRVVSVSADKLCVEHRPVLDLPFAKACLTLTGCQSSCQVVEPTVAVEPVEPIAEVAVEQTVESPTETVASEEAVSDVESVVAEASAPQIHKPPRKDRKSGKS